MKTLKSFVALIVLLTALTGCDSADNNSIETQDALTSSITIAEDSSSSTGESFVAAFDVESEQVPEQAKVTTSNELTEIFEPTGYNYYYADKFCDAVQDMVSLAKSEVDLFNSFAPILGIEETDDVSDGFKQLIDTSMEQDTLDSINSFPNILDTVCSNLENNNGDPDFTPLMRTCADSAVEYLNHVLNPTGSSSDFFETADDLYEKAITSYDDVVAYLYSIGYYSD